MPHPAILLFTFPNDVKTALFTMLCVLAFAANSLLCRMSLGHGMIDAISFTWIRLFSGAVALSFALYPQAKDHWSLKQVIAAVALLVYALGFSLAYRHISTAAGALVLFGTVQLTLFVLAKAHKEPMLWQQLLGMVIAASGLLYWLLPYWGTPSLLGFVMMTLAGMAWGIYTWQGKSVKAPMPFTACNFAIAAVMVLLSLPFWPQATVLTTEGVLLAATSGAITSALAYALWYHVLPKLNTATAANVQLSVPLWAALMGWAFLEEALTAELWVATALVMVGVVISQKKRT